MATATTISGEDAPTNSWTKVSCTADTATNGYTQGGYTDSTCSTLAVSSHGSLDQKLEPTGSCAADGSKYKKYSCASTSADVGAIDVSLYNAAGCADTELSGKWIYLINKCEPKGDEGSGKWVIENGKIQYYKWTSVLDCSGTGVAEGLLAADACTAFGSQGKSIKLGTMIDGASIDGYSALSSGGTTSNDSGEWQMIAL